MGDPGGGGWEKSAVGEKPPFRNKKESLMINCIVYIANIRIECNIFLYKKQIWNITFALSNFNL